MMYFKHKKEPNKNVQINTGKDINLGGQASLSITNSQSLLKLMSVESVMPSIISSSIVPFSSCLQSFPALGSFHENWAINKAEHWRIDAFELWTVVLEKTLENPLDCKEIQPVYPKGN